jgi:hypothetical protein
VINGGSLGGHKDQRARRASANLGLTARTSPIRGEGIAGHRLGRASFVRRPTSGRAPWHGCRSAGSADHREDESPGRLSIEVTLGRRRLMIARDLGLEVPLETLPGVQRRLVWRPACRRARDSGDQVLESMCTEPRPRAPVTDAAHAVDEASTRSYCRGNGRGAFSGAVVAALDAIVREAERDFRELKFIISQFELPR